MIQKTLKGLIFCCILWVTITCPATAHNVFASITTIEWNESDNSIEAILELHGHELEAKLSFDKNERLSFLNDEDYDKLAAATKDYVSQNFHIDTNGNKIPLTYVGMETKGQLVTIYMEASLPSAPNNIAIHNDILLDALPGQTNSVIVTIKGVRKGGDITADTGPLILSFD
ncbi:DUF6702 family protein [Kordiimonas pumila]|uniref:DUF6702 family protein n=1 Tax=Kordiimonas pumila TaxID=2161677 RepID=A0ABV7D1E5_9PROT|nr:DUF6702 family protein [Kordiimonas pumila]